MTTDPFFVEKVRDIEGLYLNPPDKALVLCVDEESQIQCVFTGYCHCTQAVLQS